METETVLRKVDVKDRLPDKSGNYYCIDPYAGKIELWFDPIEGTFEQVHLGGYYNPTHWYEAIPLTDLLAVKQETEIELSKEEVIILEIWNYCCQYNVCCNAVHPSIIKTLAGKIKAYGEFVRDSAVVSEAGEQEKEAILFFRWAISNHKWREDLGLQGLFVIPTNDNREDFYTLEEMYDKFKATAPIEKK